MFTLIEINGDHLSDMLGKPVGTVLAAIVRNTSNAERLLDESELYRAIRVVGQSGERHVYSDGKGVPKWNEIMRNAQDLALNGALAREAAEKFNVREDERVEAVLRTDGVKINPPPETPMLDTARLRLQMVAMNKEVEKLTRQMQSMDTRVEDVEDDNSIEEVAKRVDEVARRVSALEQWRKA
jgi:hypothetical protein